MHFLVSKFISLLAFTVLSLLQSPVKGDDQILTACDGSNYTSGSQFETNLNRFLPSLISEGPRRLNSFYNATSGEDPNIIYGFSQCMSASSAELCQECLRNATTDISNRCRNKREGSIRYYNCILRYSDQTFLSQPRDGDPRWYAYRIQNASDPVLFNERLGSLMRNLTASAASVPPRYAAEETNLGDFEKLYGLGQCTRDLTEKNCTSCLEKMIAEIPNKFPNQTGGNVYSLSCNIRYETYPFFEAASPPPPARVPVPNPPLAPSRSPTPPPRPRKKSTWITVVVVVASVVFIVVGVSIIWAWLWNRKPISGPSNVQDEEGVMKVESLLFNLETLRAATDNFSDANKLGEGGFGPVYKGKLRDGKEIAIKRLSRRSQQGIDELRNEIQFLAKLRHRNLVGLLGFCLEGQEKMLIYEYLRNTSLDTFLFDPWKRTQLDWERRFKIIEGIARGLLYLHEDSQLRIIHRDLKASNILLDENMTPKISDFGLAKLFGGEQTHGSTNHIAGTFGYMAPEYVVNGHFSNKSDVFSFGVLVLEIVTGRKNASFHESEGPTNLISYTWEHWRQGAALDILDPTLGEDCTASSILRCLHMGLLCVQEDAAERPTMSSVVLMLNSNSITLAVPSRPAFGVQSRMEMETTST